MLSVTDSPVDLDKAQVLTDSEADVLVTGLRTAIERAEHDEDEADDVTSQLVHRMRRNEIADLLTAIEGRTVVLADEVIDLG